jgi:hypothetical protein
MSNYKLAEIGIPLERFSEDKARVNKYGQKLVELCKRCSLYIANGPVFSLFSKIQDDYFNTENLLSLFDTYVKCIVNYGCEVWGFHKFSCGY